MKIESFLLANNDEKYHDNSDINLEKFEGGGDLERFTIV
jgi:hypothetical protein